jgi:RimJ/RimL family protein N-acetyltransferase
MLPDRVLAWPVTLRHFTDADAPQVQALAGDRSVAETTMMIPHPYPEGAALAWIATHAAERSRGSEYVFAIERAEDECLVGSIALRPLGSERENVGYWIGRDYWGRGYATAAAAAIIALAFQCLDCRQVAASHLASNPASGRVMEKCGMAIVAREARLFRGREQSVVVRGITRDAWERSVRGL